MYDIYHTRRTRRENILAECFRVRPDVCVYRAIRRARNTIGARSSQHPKTPRTSRSVQPQKVPEKGKLIERRLKKKKIGFEIIQSRSKWIENRTKLTRLRVQVFPAIYASVQYPCK